jgi:hypothetical protein
MMEAARTSETSVDNHFTRQYNPEDSSEHQIIFFSGRVNIKAFQTINQSHYTSRIGGNIPIWSRETRELSKSCSSGFIVSCDENRG